MCTGAGKTITSLVGISRIPKELLGCCPVLISVPTCVLADQWIEEIRKMGFLPPLRAYEKAQNWIGMIEP